MPGIVGLAGNRATGEALARAADALHHFDSYVVQQACPFPGLQIAQVWRNAAESAGQWHRDGTTDVSVYVNGTVIDAANAPRQIGPEDVLRAHLDDALTPERYDGSFIIVIADPRTSQLLVYNDRLGTLPLYYSSTAGTFCFAPEAKAICAALQERPEYSANGLVNFLMLGYCLADTTLFRCMHFLEPASRLIIRIPDGSYEISRYWRMSYEEDRGLRRRRRAEEALYESIVAGHEAIFSNPEESYDLLLSGGWDSRGMLATADSLGRPARRSMAWGLRDDIPYSDPFLAAQLARQYGLEHRFISYDTDAFVDNAAEWSRLTELNTDNFGWYGEGTNVLLREYAAGADFVLAGDEGWGFGEHVRNRVEAMAACHMPAPGQALLAKCLAEPLRTQCADIYSAEVDKVLASCISTDPDDRKDFLYLHGRVARFIFSLGYYKELAVEVRRPFLTTQVLDLMQRIPPRFRYGKNLYISTLIRFFPELLKVPKRSASSLPHWKRDLREKPALSRYFRNLLSMETLSKTALAEYFDLQQIEAMANGFFSQPVHDGHVVGDRSARLGRKAQVLKQHIAAYDDLRLALRLRKPASRRLHAFDVLRRIALLVLLDSSLMNGTSAPRRIRRKADIT